MLAALLAASGVVVPAVTAGGGMTQALPCDKAALQPACGTVRYVYENACDTPLAVGPSTQYFTVEPSVKCGVLQVVVPPQ